VLRVSVVIPATDRPPALDRCLEAIRAAADPPEEVIVVESPPGAIPAAARNRGVSGATGDVLVFVDSDVLVHPNVFSRIRAAFEADPDLTAVFGSYDDAPEAPGIVSGFRNLLHHHVHQEAAGPASTFWTGLGAIRREAFLGAGGFAERRYLEDVELGVRLAAAEARIDLDAELQGTHLKGWTLLDMIRTDYSGRALPWLEILCAHGHSTALNLSWRHRLSAAVSLVGLWALARRRPVPLLGAALCLVALNTSFYGLLLRRRGLSGAAAGVALHAVHHLTAVAAIPTGLLRCAESRRRAGSDGAAGRRLGE
jgi:hypothetical protein